jgi:hypothetical protein
MKHKASKFLHFDLLLIKYTSSLVIEYERVKRSKACNIFIMYDYRVIGM